MGAVSDAEVRAAVADCERPMAVARGLSTIPLLLLDDEFAKGAVGNWLVVLRMSLCPSTVDSQPLVGPAVSD